MRVVLSTISKFHNYNIARQFDRLGVLERVFTAQARWRLRGEGLPPERTTAVGALQTIYEGLARLGLQGYPLERELNWQCHQRFDRYVAAHLPPCDIFHALVYSGLRSGQAAQRRGARWICDMANSHLSYQDDLLAEEHERVGLPFRRQERRFLAYAEESYARADLLTVPSLFARRSFVERGVPEEKLALIPYGVEVGRSAPRPAPPDGIFRVLFVGQPSVRKGFHDLLEAFRLAAIPGARLLCAGVPLPETAALLRRSPGAQAEMLGHQTKQNLDRLYARADVLVLPSIEDAFGNVISEALACGCPVIGSTHTGAPDLIESGREGFVVPIRSPAAIAERLTWLHDHPAERAAMRKAAVAHIHALKGWDSYGDALLAVCERLLGRAKAVVAA